MSDNAENPSNNGAVLNIAQIIKSVVSSAAEAEIEALFINSQQAIPARTTTTELGHVQPSTPIQTDNTTALGFIMKNLTPRATKSTDMKFWWMWDRSDQQQFRYYWGPVKQNDGDYFTKHFCAANNREKRPTFFTFARVLDSLRQSPRKPPYRFRTSERVC